MNDIIADYLISMLGRIEEPNWTLTYDRAGGCPRWGPYVELESSS